MDLRTFDKYQNIKFNIFQNNDHLEKIKCTYLDLNLPDNTLIIFDDLLDNDECNEIINKTHNYYMDLSAEYLKSQRDSKRILNMNKNLADIIYERIKKYIEKETDNKKLQPFGFGVNGIWSPIGINHCFRHSVYHAPSIGFKPHRDSSYIEKPNTRSILTIIIYLNDDFIGGDTIFIKPNSDRKIGQIVEEELSDGYNIIHKITPKKGKAIIFNHNVIHAGLDVTMGSKYIMRSDILFENLNPFTNNYNDWKNNIYFLKAIEYYREANNQEMIGNIEMASELYERGLSLRQFH